MELAQTSHAVRSRPNSFTASEVFGVMALGYWSIGGASSQIN